MTKDGRMGCANVTVNPFLSWNLLFRLLRHLTKSPSSHYFWLPTHCFLLDSLCQNRVPINSKPTHQKPSRLHLLFSGSTARNMDISPVQSSPMPFFLSSRFFFPSIAAIPHNYVHWTETPESHLYTADLPGVRKEDIRVEVEDSLYLVIRTEAAAAAAEEGKRRRSFMRKFRLPRTVDVDGISARYDDGVLTVTVPRPCARGRVRLDPQDVAESHNSVARAA